MGSTVAGRTHQILRQWNSGGEGLNLSECESSRIFGESSNRATIRRHKSSKSIKRSSVHFKPPDNEEGEKERGVKWEELPLAHLAPDGTEEGGSAEPEKSEPKTIKQRLLKGLKILLPHVGLTALLLSYIAMGAAVFQFLETEVELNRRRDKLTNITILYETIIEQTNNYCDSGQKLAASRWVNVTLLPLLRQLSKVHEYDERFTDSDQLWNPDEQDQESRWTFPAAVLYALTVITTTGYDHISPLTNKGRLFTVFFGLFGIPLMFITAADIGKFLSECVTTLYAKLRQLAYFLARKLRTLCPPKPPPVRQPTANGGLRKDSEVGLMDAAEMENSLDRDQVQLPVFAYFFLILGYCAIGSLLFTQWESGPIWTFIHGFFFSFNAITTIGLGNILVRNAIYLVLIVCYVIVGLAVITMCVDLASSQLKVLFTKLHYFGRKFRGTRAFMNMSDDIKEAMKIIAALKRSRPNKGGGITLEDIKKFLEIEQQYKYRPYIPKNFQMLKWVDDEDVSSARSGSLSLKQVNSDPALHM